VAQAFGAVQPGKGTAAENAGEGCLDRARNTATGSSQRGDRFELSLLLEKGVPNFHIRARVSSLNLVGIRFQKLTPADRERLAQFLERHFGALE
jgi:hypothetical protein